MSSIRRGCPSSDTLIGPGWERSTRTRLNMRWWVIYPDISRFFSNDVVTMGGDYLPFWQQAVFERPIEYFGGCLKYLSKIRAASDTLCRQKMEKTLILNFGALSKFKTKQRQFSKFEIFELNCNVDTLKPYFTFSLNFLGLKSTLMNARKCPKNY